MNFISFIAGQALEDQCSKKPCKNGGECIQVRFGRYKCDCQGTKHYGSHCDDGNSKQNKTLNDSFEFCIFFYIRISYSKLLNFYLIVISACPETTNSSILHPRGSQRIPSECIEI